MAIAKANLETISNIDCASVPMHEESEISIRYPDYEMHPI
jgi:hypothetical protein